MPEEILQEFFFFLLYSIKERLYATATFGKESNLKTGLKKTMFNNTEFRGDVYYLLPMWKN